MTTEKNAAPSAEAQKCVQHIQCGAEEFWHAAENIDALLARVRREARAEAERLRDVALMRATSAANAGKRLATGEYIDWSSAGGPNECQHGVADRIPCAHCDRLTVNNWSDSQ